MMKKLLFGLLALTGIAMLNSCQQDEVINVAPADRGVTVTATMDNRPQSRVILGETTGTQTDIYWEEGDEFKVTIDNTEYTFTISEEYSDNAPSKTATFTCAEAPAELPAGTYTFSYEAQSATEQTGTKEGLSAYHPMQATVTANAATAWAEVVLNFATQVSMVEVTLPEGVTATKVWLYNVADGTLLANTVDGTFSDQVYFAVTPGTYTGLVLAETSEKTYMAQVGSNTLVDGKLYRIKKEMTEATERETYFDVKHAIFDGTCYIYGTGPMETIYNNNIENVVVMNGVTGISDYAFQRCDILATITLPATVTTIGEYAFSGCSSLTEITLPAGLTTIGEAAFSGCSALKDMKVDEANTVFKDVDGVLYSKDGTTIMFYPQGKTATSFTLPATVTAIGTSAFNYCEKIETFDFAAGSQLNTIGKNAFLGCDFSTINFPATLTEIGDAAFYGCEKLSSVHIPAGVTSIGNSAFFDCSLLETVTFSNESQLESVGASAFEGCVKLSSIHLPVTVTSIGSSAFSSCENLSEIIIPSGVTQLEYAVFHTCRKLTSIEIPSGVTSIGGSAFENCSQLTSITIPANVGSIGIYAFNHCTSLASVTCLSVNPPSLLYYNHEAFNNNANGRKIYVPSESVDAYKVDYYWKEYEDAIEAIRIKTAAEAVKGDYAMVDGTFISKDVTLTDTEKSNVRGIVFWTESEEGYATLTSDEILKKDFPNCNHGLIVSLKDVAKKTAWQTTAGSVHAFQTDGFTDPDKSSYKSIYCQYDDDAGTINSILGYQNTKILKAYNDQCAEDNRVLPIVSLATWEQSNPAPTNTTGWYLPSEKELSLLCGNDVENLFITKKPGTDNKDFINDILGGLSSSYKLQEAYYWSSTECTSANNYYFSFMIDSGRMSHYEKRLDSVVSGSNTYDCNVRAVCAF